MNANEVGLSANFPHKLLLLHAALNLGKLAICKELEGISERGLIGTLILHLDSKVFTRPITMGRRRLMELTGIKKSALYEKLNNLKMLGILRVSDEDATISFTDHGASLLAAHDQVNKKSKEKEKKEKKDIFAKFGGNWFPRIAACFLIDRGVSLSSIRSLISECKKHKQRIQDIVEKHNQVLSRYDGKSLYAVLRDLIRNPTKYKTKPAGEEPAKLSPADRLTLSRIASGLLPLLAPGEHITSDMLISRPQVQGGAPMPITKAVIQELELRARRACEAAIATGTKEWSGVVADGKPVIYGTKTAPSWISIFELLTPEQQLAAIPDGRPDPRIGRWFSLAGARYCVEKIDGDRVTLRMLVASGSSSILFRKTEELITTAGIVWDQR